jgi:hypothetical protein
MDPDLFKEFCAEYVREINRVRGDENARRDRLRSELAQAERRLRRIVEAIEDGVPARTLKEELLALEARQEQLEAEIAATPDAQQPLLHPNLAEIYRQKVAALAEALADEAMRDEAFELIRSLLDRIVLVPEGEELRMEMHGALAGILELCQKDKTPGRSRASAEQIKLVAGARNHLYRTSTAWVRHRRAPRPRHARPHAGVIAIRGARECFRRGAAVGPR